MAKQIYEIRDFSYGIDTQYTSRDSHQGAASYIKNVDPMAQRGLVMPINKNLSIGKELRANDFISFKTKTYGTCLLGFDGLNETDVFGNKLGVITVIKNLYGDNT